MSKFSSQAMNQRKNIDDNKPNPYSNGYALFKKGDDLKK